MKTLLVQKLSASAFAPYGQYSEMVHPVDPVTGKDLWFFPDLLTLDFGVPASTLSFSTCKTPALPFVVKAMERHSRTGEGMLPLDADCILYFGIPSLDWDEALKHLECFFVPKGTMVVIKPGVWHWAPIPVSGESVSVLIVLPTRTYANDTFNKDVPEDRWVPFELGPR